MTKTDIVEMLRNDEPRTATKWEAAAEIERLREALKDTTASLVAAHSLLSRGGKKAAPSDKMFAQMLTDYQSAIDRARSILKG